MTIPKKSASRPKRQHGVTYKPRNTFEAAFLGALPEKPTSSPDWADETVRARHKEDRGNLGARENARRLERRIDPLVDRND